MIYLYISTALLAVSLLFMAIQQRKHTKNLANHLQRILHLEKELQAAALINQTLGSRLINSEGDIKDLKI